MIHEPVPDEKRLSAAIRSHCVEIIEGLGREKTAELLGLAPTGVDALTWESEWTLERSVRVMLALGAGALEFQPRVPAWLAEEDEGTVIINPNVLEKLRIK